MKKLNKLFAILVAMAMVLSLTVISAFAENKAQNTDAAITKVLQLPKDFTLPTDFETTFTFTLQTVDGVAQAEDDTTGAIATKTITDETAYSKVAGTNENPTDEYYFSTGSLLTGVRFHGGTYVYKVEEATYTIDGVSASTDTKKLTKDSKTYYLTVQCDSLGNPTNVTVREGTPAGEKTPANPGSTTTDIQENGFKYTNKYYKINSGEGDDAILSVQKNVTGTGADTTTGFEIKVTLTAPTATGADLSGVTAYTRAKGATTTDAVTGTNGVYTVKLADGDKLCFNNLPEGTTYTIEETDARAKLSTDTTSTAAYIKSGDLGTATLNGSAGAKAVNNAYSVPEDTGILMSNLPYIVLALVAIGGMVAYVVVRRRNADEA